MSVADKKAKADELREQMLTILAGLDLESLALAAKHEYDDDAAVPTEGSSGATFLYDCRDRLIDWIRANERWPAGDGEVADASGTWHHAEATQDERADAFHELKLHFSYHATTCLYSGMAAINAILDEAAEQMTITLVSDYGPLV